MSEFVTEYSQAELMVIEMSRHLVDGDVGGVGAASTLPMAALRFAQVTHAPNLWWFSGGSGAINPSFDRLPRTSSDYINLLGAEGRARMDDVVDWETKGRWDFAFLGGMQIDKFGNVNMVCIGSYDKPAVRGPGTVGLLWLATFRKVYLYVENHRSKTFVDKVDFISGAGFLSGGDSRFDKALPTSKGPVLVFTPLCVFDFDDATHKLRLRSVHPGYTVDDVITNTGCELVIPEKVPMTAPPTKEEIYILRTRVDRGGLLMDYWKKS